MGEASFEVRTPNEIQFKITLFTRNTCSEGVCRAEICDLTVTAVNQLLHVLKGPVFFCREAVGYNCWTFEILLSLKIQFCMAQTLALVSKCIMLVFFFILSFYLS